MAKYLKNLQSGHIGGGLKVETRIERLKDFLNPGLFLVDFWSFQTNNTIFTANICEKMSSQYTAP